MIPRRDAGGSGASFSARILKKGVPSSWRTLGKCRLIVIGLGVALFLLSFCAFSLHWWVNKRAELEPPPVRLQPSELISSHGMRRMGDSFVVIRGRLREVHLRGTPETIGYAHARLLRDSMLRNEGVLYQELKRQVPTSMLRALLFDLAQWRYHAVDRGMAQARKLEIAAQALAFQPDPFRHFFSTYQRFIYLNALYDISLSFEHSPLIGCTSFILRGKRSEENRTLLARAFDFEVHDIFDEEKAVFFVQEEGSIPFASVAWPGLVGVVSGMNAEGVAIVVHGGRAGESRPHGQPVVHSLRSVLAHARTSGDAMDILRAHEPMVSHIIVVTDSRGDSRVVERVPGQKLHSFSLPEAAVVTNHFKGPAANDPRNLRVLEQTSSRAREQSGKRLIASLGERATVSKAVEFLRDRRAPDGSSLELGDRRAIDALIATHGVVMDATKRVLWVSESPHLLGRFVAFDLQEHLESSAEAPVPMGQSLPEIDPDPLLAIGGEYPH